MLAIAASHASIRKQDATTLQDAFAGPLRSCGPGCVRVGSGEEPAGIK